MDYSAIIENCFLFKDISEQDLREYLNAVTYDIRSYEKGDTIFCQMDEALRIGIILEGTVQAQKIFPNGSQINVSVREPGDMIGTAAVFSKNHIYPCDVTALERASVMLFYRDDMLKILQKDVRVLNRFVSELATAAYKLQQRLELLSYSGIAQKAAFYLLINARESGKSDIHIPGSVTNWAMIMNVSRPSLHRELNKLEKKGIISYTPPIIKILDPEALHHVLG